jgi:hypothetical protein
MPALIGTFKAVSIGSGGVLQIGDAAEIVPKDLSKTFAGSGAFNTGDGILTHNVISSTNTLDTDGTDQSIISNL